MHDTHQPAAAAADHSIVHHSANQQPEAESLRPAAAPWRTKLNQ